MTSVYLIQFLQHKASLNDLLISEEQQHQQQQQWPESLSIYLVNSIMNEFEQHCQAAKKNLLLASLHKPIYGPLAAIRTLIMHSIKE
jgi:hypothetical protein